MTGSKPGAAWSPARDLRLIAVWMWAMWRVRPGWLVAIVVLSVLNALVLVAFPWLWELVVDAMNAGAPATIQRLGFWLLVVGVGQSTLYALLQGSRTIVNAVIQQQTRRRVFGFITAQDEAFFARWGTGDLVTRLTDDAGEKTAWFLCSGVFRAVEAALVVVACLAAMAWHDRWLTAWVILPLPVLLIGQAVLQGMLAGRFRAVQAAISAVNDELASTFSAIRVVQAARLGDSARARFVAAAASQRDAEIGSARVNQAIFSMYGHGWQLAVGLLLWVGGPRVMSGEMTLGEFVAFEGFVTAMVWPMFDFGTFVAKFMQAGVALGRLQDVLDEPVPPRPGTRSDLGGTGLRVEHASVDAPSGRRLLDDVELDVRPGELVAVVGEVGSGKSTLMRLLAGAVRPATGSVSLGGVPYDAIAPAVLRSRVAWVPQDPMLLSVRLVDNVTLGREAAPADLDRAVSIARLAGDLAQLPAGLDTLVGERGVTLSGGQQQRTALARALLGGPTVLLLDDATAALDADTEAAFWGAIEDVLPGVAAVVVTHRLATIARADRVVVLEGGRVVDTGRHDALIARGGPYQRVYGRYDALARLDDPAAARGLRPDADSRQPATPSVR